MDEPSKREALDDDGDDDGDEIKNVKKTHITSRLLERSTRAPSPLATTLTGPPRRGAEAARREAWETDRAALALRARRAEVILEKVELVARGAANEFFFSGRL